MTARDRHVMAFYLQYLQAFFQVSTSTKSVGSYASYCLNTMRLTKATSRRFPPSSIEIAVSHFGVILDSSQLTALASILPPGCQES